MQVQAATTEAPPLSDRESDVLLGLAKGFTYVEIARTLGISENTIRSHVKKLYRKLQVNSRSEAVFEALHTGQLRLGI